MLTDLCIYTIKHSNDLRATLARGGSDTYTEQRNWVKGRQLLDEAKRTGRRLPIIFAPAEGTFRLFGWALLEDIVPGASTTYSFSNLQQFNRRPLKSTLRKASDGEPLERWFVRPYAICRTPARLANAVVKRRDFRVAEESDIEGMKTEVLRITGKRSRRLRDLAFVAAMGVCCVCRRDFSKMLGGRGVRVLQVHNRHQLSARLLPSSTKLGDLAVVCANCHLLLHLDPEKALAVEELQDLLRADRCFSLAGETSMQEGPT
jgi:hypothetical protein